jgi:sulfite exporter TauE/SafE
MSPLSATPSTYLIGSLIFVAFAGSWHCTLMCGPIACGLSEKGNVFYYHMGRLLSYVGGGALFGFLGNNLFQLAPLPLKVLLAFVLSAFFIAPWLPNLKIDLGLNKLIWMILKRRPQVFIVGFLSAFLPCGWLWTFYAGAAASGSAWSGALVTLVLWLSTLPALSLLPQLLKTQTRSLDPRRALIVRGVLTTAGVYAIWSHVLF